jgi:hypothetical protein
MEGIKACLSLTARRLCGLEGVTSTTGVIIRLLPQLPVRPFLAIDLLQAEILPVDL